MPVSVIVSSVADGDSWDDPAQLSQLTPDDIGAALHFAAEAVNRFDLVPLAK